MDVFDVGGCEVNTEEVDTIGLGCALEDFKEFEEVQNLICRLTDVYDNQTLSEATYQRFVYILNQYQEQPHLLDSNLQLLLEHLLSLSRNVNNDKKLQHLAFRFLYIITKVRGFKIVLRHLPHEVTDVEPVLTLLSEQDSQDCNTWETRYMLLLWMSIVVIIPFHMARLDNVNDDSCSKKKTVMERILDVIKLYLSVCDKARDAAAFLASRFITRPDVKPLYLAEYLDWSLKMLVDSDANTMIGLNLQAGVLSSLALLFKHGKRDDFIEYGAPVLKKILECGFKDSKSTTVRKMALKLIQRIGLSFLRVKVATWRYSRGTRSLADNLAQNETSCQIPIKDDSSESDADGYDIPDETEDVIEQLLVGLHDKDTVIRWSAAKGIGRVTARLPKELADDVVTSVLELFSLRESDSAWHGGCLALAELGRRGLILPQHLGKVVCVVLKALVYDELRGNFSVGAHIRDAACYVCWSFARAYEPNVLQPYVNKIAGALLITAVFDREVNCRRAASAAFQENVGRQGTFPHGIEILTTADYYAVGSRHNAFLNLSVYIGQFSEYTAAVINHLLEYKINHWDCAIRELAAKALHNLTASDPQFMSNKALPQLLSQTTGMDLNSRHGAILSVAEIVHALSNLAKNEQNIEESIDNITLEAIRDIVLKLNERKMFRGLGGIFMRTAVCLLIEKASLAGLPFHNDEELVGQWQEIIDSCLQHMEITVRLAAVSALPHFCTQYYPAESSHCLKLLNSYLLQLEANQMEIRCGYALAIGSLPSYILNGHVFRVLQALSECSKLTQDHSSWAEARRDAIKALSQMTITMGVDPCGKSDTVICKANMDALYECLLAAMDDYTLDSRGDVGAIVREAAMSAIQDVTQLIIKKDSTMISEELSSKIFCALLQQCVEKIDRTRAVAGSTFVALLYSIPEIPNVPHRKQLQEIFPMDVCKQINWASPADTFHYFVKLLYLPTYNYNLLLGFTVSVGGLTESLVKFSRVALVNYLTSINTDPDQLTSICNVLVTILKNNLHNDRIVVPFLKMADHLFVSGVKFIDINEKTTFPEQLLDLSWQASFKSSDPQKLLAAVDLFCDLLQFHGSCQKRALSRLTIFLCHRFPRVRKVTASKFYEAVISYDILSDDVLDEVISILSETDWDAPVDSLRPIRNNLCEFFGVPPPRLKSK